MRIDIRSAEYVAHIWKKNDEKNRREKILLIKSQLLDDIAEMSADEDDV